MTFLTVGDLVSLGARRSPKRVALKIRDGAAIRYDELDERTNRLANGLLGSGLAPGDRVGTWMEDRLDYPELWLAIAKAGLVIVPINTRYQPEETQYCLVDSGARGLIWTDGMADRVDRLEGLPESTLLVSNDGSGPPGTHKLTELVERGSPTRPPAPDPDDLLALAYTSGTTGHPKGAMLTHRTVLAICRLNTMSYRLPAYSVAAVTGTLSFPAIMPAHVLSHLYVGGTAVIMGQWDPEILVDTIERERITFTYLPTPTMQDFTEYARTVPTRWATLESVLHSASRATPEQRRALCDLIGDRFVEGWGMTENSGGLMTATTSADILNPPEDIDIHSSAGRAVIEMVVDVVDEAGNSLPHDGETLGELIYRGPAVMRGYWNRPDATATALRDGWLRSGDLGTVDANGYITVTERRTDLIVSGGMNVYPSEVEQCVHRLGGVRECVVVGVPHERWGRTVVAVVIGPATTTESDVIEHCRQHLASYKKPTRVVFVDDAPRTPSLKVRRSELRDLVTQQLAAPIPQGGAGLDRSTLHG